MPQMYLAHMIKWVASAVAVGLAYLCERPGVVAFSGLQESVMGNKRRAAFLKQVYLLLSKLHMALHRRPPQSSIDQLAFKLWHWPDNEESESQRSRVLSEISELQNQEVELKAHENELIAMQDSVFGSEFVDWHDFGFQRPTPETDFRGSGVLGLTLFHAFCTENTEKCRLLVIESQSASSLTAKGPWYPVALVSIRLTVAYKAILDRSPVLVLALGENWLSTLKSLHASILTEFHSMWLNGLETGRVKTYFDTEVVLKDLEGRLPANMLKRLVK